ncbi:EF-hand domain-containing protein [Actinokineospora guangxiensis]|uniref:EF-hand domain-containing protein n=1 Tax=Actinokineospora guangxiensis TaxID=1490288 RepID=A0ABW0EVS6_9PSEU
MSSRLQRGKVSAVFRSMDGDGDGYLTEADFRSITERWAELRGSTPADHDRVAAIMLGWWTALAEVADTDHDDRVTVEEVMTLVDRLPAMLGSVTATASALFDAADANRDDLISATEYRALIEAWSGRRADTDAVFDILDDDADGHLSREDFTELWTQFWAGDDPAAPGNWVFGRFTLPTA